MPIIRRFPTSVISGGRVAGSLSVQGDLSVLGDFDPTTVGQDTVPKTDNTYDLGSPTQRWAYIYAGNGVFGDIIFGETRCPLCERRFEPADHIGLIVRKTTDEGTHMVPVHLECQLKNLGVL